MNAIKAYKVKKRLSYTDMARLIGINTATLWRHAEGQRGVSLAIARKYHTKFGIPLSKIPTEAVKA
jgi:DNA-binding XRE family transcriptional regulator